jgi:hypothetical protein
MNSKQAVLDKLSNKGKEEILEQLKENFIKEDNKEPFTNRSYVEDTLQIFDMLISGDEDEFITIQGSALCDVISDIFRYLDRDRFYGDL